MGIGEGATCLARILLVGRGSVASSRRLVLAMTTRAAGMGSDRLDEVAGFLDVEGERYGVGKLTP